jgi:DNA-binding Lrp family transcriptional regulator
VVLLKSDLKEEQYMDNFNSSNPFSNNLNEPIPLDKDVDEPIPFDDADMSETGVSHSPLDLGGSGTAEPPKIEVPKPVVKEVEKVVSTDRIVGVKTFFTKLHAGAINFLDEQIIKWLKENPGVTIKRTNIVTGEIQAKKTEPNIIISIWY